MKNCPFTDFYRRDAGTKRSNNGKIKTRVKNISEVPNPKIPFFYNFISGSFRQTQ